MIEEPANENRDLEYGCLDRDRHYVADYLRKAVAHFQDCKIHPETIQDGLVNEIIGLLTGDPKEPDALDEGSLWSNVYKLWDVQFTVKRHLKAQLAALRRIDRRRQAKHRRPRR